MTKRNQIVEQMPYAVTTVSGGAHLVVARFRSQLDADLFRDTKASDGSCGSDLGVIFQSYNHKDRLVMTVCDGEK